VSSDGSLADNGTTVPDACVAVTGFSGWGHPRFVGDGQLWMTGYNAGTAFLFKRDLLPTCADGSVSVPYNTSVAVPLSCADRNGDPVTLEIARAPVSGTVGAIDAANGRVFYNPFAGFSGADAFQYRGVAAGQAGPPATVAVAVQAGPVDADGDGSPAGVDCDDNDRRRRPGATDVPGDGIDQDCVDGDAPAVIATRITWGMVPGRQWSRFTSLRLTRLPKGARVSIACSGKGCPFTKRRRVAVRRNATSAEISSAINRKRKGRPRKVAKLRPGARLVVTVTAPNRIGRRFVLTVRKRKNAKLTLRCLAVGSVTRTTRCPG
jgi:hypothetical protein